MIFAETGLEKLKSQNQKEWELLAYIAGAEGCCEEDVLRYLKTDRLKDFYEAGFLNTYICELIKIYDHCVGIENDACKLVGYNDSIPSVKCELQNYLGRVRKEWDRKYADNVDMKQYAEYVCSLDGDECLESGNDFVVLELAKFITDGHDYNESWFDDTELSKFASLISTQVEQIEDFARYCIENRIVGGSLSCFLLAAMRSL